MEGLLMAILEQLDLISVRGGDVERMAYVRRNMIRILNALRDAKGEKQKEGETKDGEHV